MSDELILFVEALDILGCGVRGGRELIDSGELIPVYLDGTRAARFSKRQVEELKQRLWKNL